MGNDPLRPEAIVRSIHRLVCLAFLLCVSAFVFRYRSDAPAVGPYSVRYLGGVILPFLAIAAVMAAASFGSGARSDPGGPRSRRMPGPLALALGAAALAAGWAWSWKVSDEFVSVGMALLVPAAVLGVASRWSRSVEPLMAGSILLAAGTCLFATELPGVLGRPALVTWGDTATFATLFPRQAPFIGEGGRLRPRLDVRMRAPEYRTGARLVTDPHGFRNSGEIPRRPDPGEYRILSLGDSFSTGFCSDQEAFFGTLLEKSLAARLGPGRRVRVLNAEVSDPAYGLHYLQTHGMSFRPDLVIYGLSGNDAMQSEQFYGPDRLFTMSGGRLRPNPRFDPAVLAAWDRYAPFAYPAAGAPAGSSGALAMAAATKLLRFGVFHGIVQAAISSRQVPADMPGYATPHEAADGRKRLIDGASNLGFHYRPGGAPVEEMEAALFDLVGAMAETSREGGAGFLLVIHPQRYQVQPPDWDFLVRRWNLDPEDFDLRLANRRLAAGCGRLKLPCCDLVDAFAAAWKADGPGLYLPAGDTHYNRHGHRVAAEQAASCVVREHKPPL
jgi:hypothetical protein